MADINFEDIQPFVEGQGDTGKTAREKINRNFKKLKGFDDAVRDIATLQGRDKPIVFTESKDFNACIKKLFIDISDYVDFASVVNLSVNYVNSSIGLWSDVSGGFIINWITLSGKGVYCERFANGVFYYLEIDESKLPTASNTRTKLTSWATSPACDPRITAQGVTENPLVNKYLTALYVDLTNYTGESEEIKNGWRLYGLRNNVNNNVQYYIGLTNSNGSNLYLWQSNEKPPTIVEKTFNVTDKGSVRVIAKVDWDGLVGKSWGSQRIKLNPCAFEKDFFYAVIEQSEGEGGEIITIDGLKSLFSTRVYTKKATHNQVIKKLFIDTSGYTGSADLSGGIRINNLAKKVANLYGIQLRLLNEATVIASFWMSQPRNKQSTTVSGIYLYAEYDWNAIEDGTSLYGAEFTDEVFNPINDPRKSVGLQNLTDEVVSLITTPSQSGGATTPLTGGVYGCVGDSITQGLGSTTLSNDDLFCPLTGEKKLTYGYLIAKANLMSWHNYGLSGSTLGDVTANGVSHMGFAKANGKYTQLANDLTHITIFFGWNDHAQGHIMKREDWLLAQYGKTYYTTDSNKFGTLHTDGTPYVTQAQFDACNAVTGEVDGITYNDSALYWRALYIGTPNDTTPNTFWGAWNIVLPYLINKYPMAKILLIVPYLDSTSVAAKLLQDTVRKAANKYGLCIYDFNKKDGQLFAWGWSDEESVDGKIDENTTVKKFRRNNLLYDYTHPNENGYKYMYSSINAKLCSI